VAPDAFHAALRDDPDDDFTRLVYADWLDDLGHCDRAPFVRLAVGLSRLGCLRLRTASYGEAERARQYVLESPHYRPAMRFEA
jgi:uncharacterized protein (TIGR02996 family)